MAEKLEIWNLGVSRRNQSISNTCPCVFTNKGILRAGNKYAYYKVKIIALRIVSPSIKIHFLSLWGWVSIFSFPIVVLFFLGLEELMGFDELETLDFAKLVSISFCIKLHNFKYIYKPLKRQKQPSINIKLAWLINIHHHLEQL